MSLAIQRCLDTSIQQGGNYLIREMKLCMIVQGALHQDKQPSFLRPAGSQRAESPMVLEAIMFTIVHITNLIHPSISGMT